MLVAAEDPVVRRVRLVRAVAGRDRQGEHFAGAEVGDGRAHEVVVDGDLLEGEREVAAGEGGVDELEHAGAQGHVGDGRAGHRVGGDRAVGTGDAELLHDALVAGAADDEQVGVERLGRQRHVHVAGVGVDAAHEPAGLLDAGPEQDGVGRTVTVDHGVAVGLRARQRLLADVEHDDVEAGGGEVACHEGADAPVPADDVVPTQ